MFLIAGPCAIESRQLAFDTAGELKEICAALDVPFIYKSSFDKANRSSDKSFRGVGMDEGLRILGDVRYSSTRMQTMEPRPGPSVVYGGAHEEPAA